MGDREVESLWGCTAAAWRLASADGWADGEDSEAPLASPLFDNAMEVMLDLDIEDDLVGRYFRGEELTDRMIFEVSPAADAHAIRAYAAEIGYGRPYPFA